ncbi:MAG: dihydroorotate dehydrogenase (quinone) [Bacteroidetes bacterium B1(2017)]|nr:MAG: dihydroorotate dehydrogenase (quinone) [Bacteroidetes bacterium B1(2017)]
MLYSLLRSILFMMPPERAHYFTFHSLRFFMKIPLVRALCFQTFKVENSYDFLGLKFTNRVGLAAGLDKNAGYLHELSALGFGFIEIGTVTPKPQPGNDLPRLFRLKKDEALINRMGFNNDGVEVVAQRLKNRPAGLIVGGNIGKNKITPNENASDDYAICFDKLYEVVDYFVVNVSSPNTPNLRELQDKKPLLEILTRLVKLRNEWIKKGKISKPILLKIAPDLTDTQIDDVIEIVEESAIDGLVATNTTISREGLFASKEQVEAIGAGGLSGKVLQKRSTDVIKYISTKTKGSIPIIGVGGIHNAESALEKIEAGASLVQVYTGFIYAGPNLVKQAARLIKKKSI